MSGNGIFWSMIFNRTSFIFGKRIDWINFKISAIFIFQPRTQGSFTCGAPGPWERGCFIFAQKRDCNLTLEKIACKSNNFQKNIVHRLQHEKKNEQKNFVPPPPPPPSIIKWCIPTVYTCARAFWREISRQNSYSTTRASCRILWSLPGSLLC